MKGIIVYRSTYGSTLQYAQWISEKTGFPSIKHDQLNFQDLKDSDLVIIGCSIVKDEPSLKKWIIRSWNSLKHKKLVLFTTSGADPLHPKLRQGFERSFAPQIQEVLHYIPCGGRMVFKNLKPLHRLLMKLAHKIVKDPEAKANMLKDVDRVEKKYIEPILNLILA